MEESAKTVTVEILGRTLTLASPILPEKLQAVARMVDEQLRELQRAFPASPVADLAILAALNLACEYMENKEGYQALQEHYQQLQQEIETRSRQLLQKLAVHDHGAPPGP